MPGNTRQHTARNSRVSTSPPVPFVHGEQEEEKNRKRKKAKNRVRAKERVGKNTSPRTKEPNNHHYRKEAAGKGEEEEEGIMRYDAWQEAQIPRRICTGASHDTPNESKRKRTLSWFCKVKATKIHTMSEERRKRRGQKSHSQRDNGALPRLASTVEARVTLELRSTHHPRRSSSCHPRAHRSRCKWPSRPRFCSHQRSEGRRVVRRAEALGPFSRHRRSAWVAAVCGWGWGDLGRRRTGLWAVAGTGRWAAAENVFVGGVALGEAGGQPRQTIYNNTSQPHMSPKKIDTHCHFQSFTSAVDVLNSLVLNSNFQLASFIFQFWFNLERLSCSHLKRSRILPT
ncbi:hypothetical protein B0H13DRAFT_1868387 [Mycena leptocephala]|nr:hypothetical protein B0H13DRAFT_1868387 [Mycena leptocephala]